MPFSAAFLDRSAGIRKRMMNTAQVRTLAVSTTTGELATYLQEMREQERGDLARELHDELGSLLTGAKLEVASLQARLGDASGDIRHRLAHLSKTINSGIAFSRRVVEGLHPSSLTNLGLTASLEILAREFGLSTGITMDTRFEEVELDEAAQLTVYRVVQESLNNTSKYAKATDAQVVLLDCGTDLVITVRDNGVGFDVAAKGTSSHGLAGMQHRVGACGGQLTVSSSRDAGTLVVAVLRKVPGAVAPLQCGTRQAREPRAMRPIVARARQQTH
jgi:signal transduction histidine kinase